MAQNLDFGNLRLTLFGEFRRLTMALKEYHSPLPRKPVWPAEPAPHRRVGGIPAARLAFYEWGGIF